MRCSMVRCSNRGWTLSSRFASPIHRSCNIRAALQYTDRCAGVALTRRWLKFVGDAAKKTDERHEGKVARPQALVEESHALKAHSVVAPEWPKRAVAALT